MHTATVLIPQIVMGRDRVIKPTYALADLVRVLRQRVHTSTSLPLANLIFLVLGCQVRLVRRLEWLTLWPTCLPLPQISQILLIGFP